MYKLILDMRVNVASLHKVKCKILFRSSVGGYRLQCIERRKLTDLDLLRLSSVTADVLK